MKTIELSNKIYSEVLRLKNMVSMDSGHITNPEVRKQLQIPSKGAWTIKTELFGRIMWEKDFEPEFTFEKFFKNLSDIVWEEQETKKVIRFDQWR